jgi:glycosyltransferase involved in cell wall biosynthesis
MMRIHVIARDIQRLDSVGNFCRQVHAFLVSKGFDVTLAAENCDPDDRATIARLPDAIPQIAVEDVVIFNFSTMDPAFPAIAALDRAKILYFHNITPERFFAGVDERTAQLVKLGFEQRTLAASFDVLMANSRTTARVLYEGLTATDRERISETAIVNCPPVIDAGRWTRISEQAAAGGADSRTVLYVGRLAPHKGVLQLIEGFTLLAATDDRLRLVCVGGSPDSPHTSTLVERVAALEPSIGRRIRFMHGIADEVLKSIYHNVGVCASMSQHEGFGISLVDALLFDKPLVINAEAGMMESVGDAAIVVNASIPRSVADALGAALDDDATRRRLASARRARLDSFRHFSDGHLILNAVNQARALHRARTV